MKSCVYLFAAMMATIEPYYYSRDYDSVTHWRHGHHPGALFGIECFISEEIGAIYLPGLEKVLYGTLWEYCALRQFYEQTYNPMQVSYYLKMYLQHPLLIERLTKVGFRDIVSDVVYRDGFSDALDETQTKTHRILRVQKEVPYRCWTGWCRQKRPADPWWC